MAFSPYQHGCRHGWFPRRRRRGTSQARAIARSAASLATPGQEAPQSTRLTIASIPRMSARCATSLARVPGSSRFGASDSGSGTADSRCFVMGGEMKQTARTTDTRRCPGERRRVRSRNVERRATSGRGQLPVPGCVHQLGTGLQQIPRLYEECERILGGRPVDGLRERTTGGHLPGLSSIRRRRRCAPGC